MALLISSIWGGISLNSELVCSQPKTIDLNGRTLDCGRDRILVSRDGVRTVSTNGMTPGMYVLRLIQGDNVKTQKIVIE